jgi:hypothetical protein
MVRQTDVTIAERHSPDCRTQRQTGMGAFPLGVLPLPPPDLPGIRGSFVKEQLRTPLVVLRRLLNLLVRVESGVVSALAKPGGSECSAGSADRNRQELRAAVRDPFPFVDTAAGVTSLRAGE